MRGRRQDEYADHPIARLHKKLVGTMGDDAPRLVKTDAEAVDRWLERNPDATPEEVRQALLAPDHVLYDSAEDEEA
jgi:hypothetical protein